MHLPVNYLKRLKRLKRLKHPIYGKRLTDE